MRTSLTLTAAQHHQLFSHLLSGDGLEAVALVLCGVAKSETRDRLLVHEITLVPHTECDRQADRIRWPTRYLVPLLQKAAHRGLAVVKLHSHPGGHAEFSVVDDTADAELFPSIHAAVDGDMPHCSAIMLPDGKIRARVHNATGQTEPVSSVNVVGDNLTFWGREALETELPEYARRHIQAFGAGTFSQMRDLSVAVVGCSGTGSVVIDILARLGVGRLVLVDPDRVEPKNLNRILNTSASDVGRLKIEVAADLVARLGFGTAIECYGTDLAHRSAIGAVASCDVAVGCMDSVDGRQLLNRLATFYLLAYFDVGVRLDADGKGGVDQICGTVHYLQPGMSTLMSRGAHTSEQVRAAAMMRTDPVGYREQVERGYLRGVQEDRPAVNAVNMLFSSLLVLELLARLHDYRMDGNAGFARQTLSLTLAAWLKQGETAPDLSLARFVGRGDMVPPLDYPYLDGGAP